tara:strand:- start:135 stop:821 length:687 start_codon:yes stop_codon:yes gene_type:complete
MSKIHFLHSGGDKVTLTTPASNPSTNPVFKLPQTDGSSGEAIVTDGSGALSFANVASPYSFTQWYMTADHVINTGNNSGNENDVIENWAESNAESYERLGTAPTYSSGQFTLPSTGYWKFTAHMIFYHASGGVGDTFAFSLRKSTDSGSSFGVIGMTGGRIDGTTQPNNKMCWTVSAVTKIANISTHRIDIFGIAMATTGGARVMGGTQVDINNTGGSALLIEKVANL